VYLLVLCRLAELNTVYYVIIVYYPDQQMHNVYRVILSLEVPNNCL